MEAIIFLYNLTIVVVGIIIFICYFLVFEGKSKENNYFQNRINIMDETEKAQIKIDRFSVKKISYLNILIFAILLLFLKKEWIV